MLELALIIFGITAAVGIALGMYLSNVCTRVSDDEEYESNHYGSGEFEGIMVKDDKEILDKLNKDFRKER